MSQSSIYFLHVVRSGMSRCSAYLTNCACALVETLMSTFRTPIKVLFCFMRYLLVHTDTNMWHLRMRISFSGLFFFLVCSVSRSSGFEEPIPKYIKDATSLNNFRKNLMKLLANQLRRPYLSVSMNGRYSSFGV